MINREKLSPKKCLHCQSYISQNSSKTEENLLWDMPPDEAQFEIAGHDTSSTNLDINFCCSGCELAYKIVKKSGFENYYRLREIDEKERKIKPEFLSRIEISNFSTVTKNGDYEISLMLQGLHCAACVWLIEGILRKEKNVKIARVNIAKKTLLLRWGGDVNLGNHLISLVEKIGYKLIPFDPEILDFEEKKYEELILKSLAVAGFGAGNVMLFSIALWFFDASQMGIGTRSLLNFFSSLIALPIISYSARPFFYSAFKSVKSGHPNMDLAISI